MTVFCVWALALSEFGAQVAKLSASNVKQSVRAQTVGSEVVDPQKVLGGR